MGGRSAWLLALILLACKYHLHPRKSWPIRVLAVLHLSWSRLIGSVVVVSRGCLDKGTSSAAGASPIVQLIIPMLSLLTALLSDLGEFRAADAGILE